MDEHSSEVVRVLLDSIVKRFDLFLIKKAQHTFFQLATSLARDDLNQFDFLFDRLINDVPKRAIDVIPSVVDLVQIEL